jgi:two-component system CheB/CheR fusion protein
VDNAPPTKAAAGATDFARLPDVHNQPTPHSPAASELLYHRLFDEATRKLEAEIDARKRAVEAHSDALRRLVDAEERERRRVSRELHDQLGQDLTALKLGLKVFRAQDTMSPALQKCVRQLDQLADKLLRDVHRLAWELRPVALDDFGLELALQRYARDWSGQTGVPLDFHSQGLEQSRLPPEVETTFYRVAQEALTNISRHAQAHRVSLILEQRHGGVSLIIEDDGIGFDTTLAAADSPQPRQLGLLGMRERVLLAGGQFNVESSASAGTAVYARIPIAPPPAGP